MTDDPSFPRFRLAPSTYASAEYELDDEGARTGRWRRAQFWSTVGDKRPPSLRSVRPWRDPPVRPTAT